MKKLSHSLILLAVLFGVSSLKVDQEQANTPFEKVFFLEIDAKTDTALFVPYSQAWNDSWRFVYTDVFHSGSGLMNSADYNGSFNQRKDNLYTLIHPMVINGDITLYSPYDPKMYGLGGYDHGELRYPIQGQDANVNFINSQALCDEMCFYLGQFGPQPDVPIITAYGKDSIITQPDGTQYFVYPPRDYVWYRDSDIIKYKVRARVIIKKNGKEKKRIIEAIAPVVHRMDDGQITGERELFWLDYNELKPYLEEGYFFNQTKKPVTYVEYIEDKVNAATDID